MKRLRLAPGIAAAMFLIGAPTVHAQDLQEVCPDSEDGQGALWGVLADPDAGMGLPGATVRATWSGDDPGTAEAQTNFDGSYVLCYVPLEAELSLAGAFSSMAGQAVTLTLTEPFTEQNLSLSMTGGGGGGGGEDDDRLWVCFSGGESEFNLQYARLIRCEANWEPLENCPKQELGSVSVSPLGDGGGRVRDMIERLVADGKRLGANALINVREHRASERVGAAPVEDLRGIRATAVKIDVDPSTCT